MRRALPLVAALAITLVAGCTVGPRYTGPPASAVVHEPEANAPFVSAQGPAFSTDPAPGDWWRLYADPRLDQLISEAFAANTDLRIAEANLEKAAALVGEARARRQPSIEVNVSPSAQQLSTQSYLLSGVLPPFGLIDTGVSISYEVDLFGQLHRGVQAARADEEAARAARDLVKINVAAATARAYAEACGAGEELVQARRAVALQQETRQLTERLVRAGRGTALDLTRVNAQVSQFEADVPALLAVQRNALYRLAVLTGRPPADYPRDLESCATAPRLVKAIPIGDGAAMIRRRPDIREAERLLASSTYRIGVAVGDLYPTVTFGVTAGSTGLFKDVFRPETDRTGVSPSLVWQANRNGARARIAGAQADDRAALARFDGVVLSALRETESDLTDYSHDLDRHAALVAVDTQAQTALDQATALYARGRVGSLSVLDAQRTAASAARAVATSDAQLSADQVALFLALGGGWESSATSAAR
ncbi:MAG: TolC family protein [Caulobacteraceae bacterium]|nr:TolC family protein [Caulobacteraceae bacterium]